MSMGYTPTNLKTNIANNNNHKKNNNSSSSNSNIESWGMGFLFIFFPEDDDNNNNNIKRKHNSFSNFSSSYSTLKLSNSSHLLSKAQSTISICVLLIFVTLLLFTLSTFEPTTTKISSSSRTHSILHKQNKIPFPHALQGMGSLYRRGTRAMTNLVIAHVTESVTKTEFRIFLRLLHRSGITSKSDVLFLFSSKTISFDNIIIEENVSFSKMMSLNTSQFVRTEKEKESGEPIWGRKIRENGNSNSSRSNNNNSNNVTESSSTRLTARLSYGSVVSFDTDELDPEDVLSGFFLPERVPMNLRRWACYPMLLGRVRRNFKHVMLVDVKENYVLGDSLSQLRNYNSETVIVTTLPPPTSRKRNSEKKVVNSGFVLGGTRGVRRLANAMLTEIVRVITATTNHKKKRNIVSESTLFNQLVANEFILKNVNLIVSSESTHELSSLTGLMNSNSNSSSSSIFISKLPIVRRGNSNLDISYVFKKYLCSSPLDAIAYSDC